MRQRELEIKLERVPRHPDPSPDLEQFRTPAPIAADLLYRALACGDIQGRSVFDLGCGTGMLLAGAGLLGAARLGGVDIDPTSVAMATATLESFGLEATLSTGPVEEAQGTWDTVVMNPPFGAQHAQRHADSKFVEHALRLGTCAYSLHLEATLDHLARLVGRLDADMEILTTYQYPLRAQFRFHTKEKVLVPVVLIRVQRMGTA